MAELKSLFDDYLEDNCPECGATNVGEYIATNFWSEYPSGVYCYDCKFCGRSIEVIADVFTNEIVDRRIFYIVGI